MGAFVEAFVDRLVDRLGSTEGLGSILGFAVGAVGCAVGCVVGFVVGFAVDFVGLARGLGALEDFEGPEDCAIWSSKWTLGFLERIDLRSIGSAMIIKFK